MTSAACQGGQDQLRIRSTGIKLSTIAPSAPHASIPRSVAIGQRSRPVLRLARGGSPVTPARKSSLPSPARCQCQKFPVVDPSERAYIAVTGLKQAPVRRSCVKALRRSPSEECATMDEAFFSSRRMISHQRLGSAADLARRQVLFTTTDKIFADPGKVALWTKADSDDRFRRDRDHPTALTNFPATRTETGDDDQPRTPRFRAERCTAGGRCRIGRCGVHLDRPQRKSPPQRPPGAKLYDLRHQADVVRPSEDQRLVGENSDQPLREQLQRRGQTPQRHQRTACRARFCQGPRVPDQRAQARRADRG